MDLNAGPEYIDFRENVLSFLEKNKHMAGKARTPVRPSSEELKWQKKLIDNGYAARTIPKKYGGYGAQSDVLKSRIIAEEFSKANIPMGMANQGISMLVPTLLELGSDDQKNEWISKTISGEVIWCQGYSEPGSGSDLASLRTKAVRDGDNYIVNGTKTWNTLGQHADMIFCLVRTSDEDIPQKGISFLLIDMHSPGIEVQPIVTIDNPPEGFQEINMVHFTDVRVPVENLIGEEGKGWTYAKYLLEFERGNAYSHGLKASLEGVRGMAAAESDGTGKSMVNNVEFNRKLASTEIAISAMEFTELRILSSLATGKNVGPESSLLKCRGTELQQELTELAVEASGNYVVPFSNPAPGSNDEPIGSEAANASAPNYFNTRKVSIYAGSNEIQRNIMSKLVLGL